MSPPIVLQVEKLLSQYEAEPDHVRQVAHLADLLYLGLQKWHGLGEKEQEWLQVAAHLHDIGWSQTSDGGGHHKHSARLIAAHAWEGLTAREVGMIAQVARYHRKSLPLPTHLDYMALTPPEQRQVDILAGILRVADALDRTHVSLVREVGVTLTPASIELLIHAAMPCPAELSTVEKKKDLLEMASRRRVLARATQ
jgi:exopolyphosphatase / guanosine-5'-triphosphate,3'-diphosphate pyrophosphatase